MILDTGKLWFRVVEKEGRQFLLKTEGPENYSQIIRPTDWKVIDFRKLQELEDKTLIQQIDDFFGTHFSEFEMMNSSSQIFRNKGYMYRVVTQGDQKVLQRTALPQDTTEKKLRSDHVLVYDNFKVTSKTVVWKDVYDGEDFLTNIDDDSLREINQFFGLEIHRFAKSA